ncbi:MAG: adenosylcobinamide-GDP ribazoletransferase [Marinobacterium sp.]|nr:adenosylcobinamide-GDP ribazoletransferase [Marinobacterium sp.]
MIFYLRAALVALQFLSQIPVNFRHWPSEREVGWSVCFYPLVGLCCGGLLWSGAYLLSGAPVMVTAVLLLLVWVWFSGALHLDGLADSADAWLGGRGDRQRTLAIMKDPTAGPLAVVVLVLVLLLKAVLIAALLQQALYWPLLLAPVVGRMVPPLLLLTTPYVRPQGLGQMLVDQLPRLQLGWILAGWALFLLAFSPWAVALTLIGLLLLHRLLRRLMLVRLGGATGDTLGAALELQETAWLLGLVLLL